MSACIAVPTLQVGKHVIHEAADELTKNLGEQNLRGILRVSSNVGMAQFGMHLGADKLYEYEQKFGFLDLPGSGLPGETKSPLAAPDAPNHFTGGIGWSQIQLANISFGQGISVTPLQLAVRLLRGCQWRNADAPAHCSRSIRRDGQDSPVAPEAIRRVLDPQVAQTVRSMLGTVVQDGTGKPAQIADFLGGRQDRLRAGFWAARL